MPDHVHMMISIPPKYAVSQVIGYIKGKSAIHLARVTGSGSAISQASTSGPGGGRRCAESAYALIMRGMLRSMTVPTQMSHGHPP